MTADREFVSTTGTRHRVAHMRGQQFSVDLRPTLALTECGRTFGIGLVVQQPVKDCKRCYPEGGR